MQKISQYQKEQNEVLQKWLDNLISYWQQPYPERQKAPFDMFLELYITGTCNQKCSYCYLTNFGESLYPIEIRNPDEILQNLEILYDYLVEKQVILSRMDFFSGEIWGTSFGDKILNKTLEYICKKHLDIRCIIIPTNFSFCQNIETMTKMSKYIDAFQRVNCNIQLSCSIDGLILDNLNRPFNNDKLKTFDFYSNVFSFVKKHNFGFHPMIAAANIEKQIENYDAWLAAFKQVYGPNPQNYYGLLMQLEVRNDDWTDEKILSYCKWLNHIMEVDKKEFFENNDKLFKDFVLQGKLDGWSYKFSSSYNPYRLLQSAGPYSGCAHCTIGTMLCIRLGDLAIVPCHRTSYEKFIFGHFEVENNKIIGIQAKNIPLLNSIYRQSFAIKPKCDTCTYEPYCLRGCLGSQYENTGDLFYPVSSVCNLQQAKIIFLYEKLIKMGYLDDTEDFLVQSFLNDYNKIKNTEEYPKWKTLIQEIL